MNARGGNILDNNDIDTLMASLSTLTRNQDTLIKQNEEIIRLLKITYLKETEVANTLTTIRFQNN